MSGSIHATPGDGLIRPAPPPIARPGTPDAPDRPAPRPPDKPLPFDAFLRDANQLHPPLPYASFLQQAAQRGEPRPRARTTAGPDLGTPRLGQVSPAPQRQEVQRVLTAYRKLVHLPGGRLIDVIV